MVGTIKDNSQNWLVTFFYSDLYFETDAGKFLLLALPVSPPQGSTHPHLVINVIRWLCQMRPGLLDGGENWTEMESTLLKGLLFVNWLVSFFLLVWKVWIKCIYFWIMPFLMCRITTAGRLQLMHSYRFIFVDSRLFLNLPSAVRGVALPQIVNY